MKWTFGLCVMLLIGCSNAVPLVGLSEDDPDPVDADIEDGDVDFDAPVEPEPIRDAMPDPEPAFDVPEPDPIDVSDVMPDPMPDPVDDPEPDAAPDVEPDPEPMPLRYTSVSAGKRISCALVSDGTLRCWGTPERRGGTPMPTEANFVEVTVGDHHACARREDNTAVCWGNNMEDQLEVEPPDTLFSTLEAGSEHTCGLTMASPSTAVCWGRTGMEGEIIPPMEEVSNGVFEPMRFVEIGSGEKLSCGIKFVGGAVCWGKDMNDGSIPVADRDVGENLSIGDKQACVRGNSGEPICWGKDDGPEDGQFFDRLPDMIPEVYDLGRILGCGLPPIGISCWGKDTQDQASPPLGLQSKVYTQISAGREHVCALDIDGQIDCWGDERHEEQMVPPLEMQE